LRASACFPATLIFTQIERILPVVWSSIRFCLLVRLSQSVSDRERKDRGQDVVGHGEPGPRRRKRKMTNNQSPITNNQFFVLLLRPDPQQKAFVIG
jgi:hypothetical protein